jgi:hypothetical protein
MRHLTFAVVASLTMAFALSASAQERVAPATTGTTQNTSGQLSPGQTAMQNAAASGKFLFIHFWKEKNTQTDKTWKTLQAGAAKFTDPAEVVSLRTTDPAEKAIVDLFNVSKAPMPLILAIAPCGAVTKAFPGSLDEKQLASAFVSPSEQLCMKAIQSRKMVFVCMTYDVGSDGQASIPQGVKDFQADEKYVKATEIVTLNATDKREAGFLKELQTATKTQKPVSVLLAPGALVGTFDSTATKQQIVAKLAALQSDPCAGGKCGPNGCGPKK